jgi:hypothetical protein
MYNVVIFLTILEKYFYWNFSYVSKKERSNKIFIRINISLKFSKIYCPHCKKLVARSCKHFL